ncbi:Fc.00g106590.m01.CDS01 [Cosmosporella sp. VM-42]
MERDGELYHRAQECVALFRACSDLASLAEDDWLEDRAADFMWFAHGLNALKTGRSSLDFRVRNRPDVQQVISNLLESLSLALKKTLESGNQAVDDSSDEPLSDNDVTRGPEDRTTVPTSEDSGSNSSWSEFSDEVKNQESEASNLESSKLEDSGHRFYIQTYLGLLAKISISIRKSGTKIRYLKADTYLQEHLQDDEFCQLRKHLLCVTLVGPYEHRLFGTLQHWVFKGKLQKAVAIVVQAWISDPSRATAVQQRFIEANVIRRNRILYARHRDKSGLPAEIKGKRPLVVPTLPTPEILAQPLTAQAQPDLDKPPGPEAADQTQPTTTKSVKSLTATELGSQFLLPHLPRPESKKASSVVTKMTRTGAKQDYPGCPAKKGSFKCPYCVQVLSEEYTVNSRWRGHVAQDLNPYSCVYDDCPNTDELYQTKEEWMKHTTTVHSNQQWVCDECTFHDDDGDGEEAVFEDEKQWKEHMLYCHKDACSVSQMALLASLSKRQLSEPTGCPLCKRPNGFTRPDMDEHIAVHLHSWALRALPWDLDGETREMSGSEASVGSNDDVARISNMSDLPTSIDSESDEELFKMRKGFTKMRQLGASTFRKRSHSRMSDTDSDGEDRTVYDIEKEMVQWKDHVYRDPDLIDDHIGGLAPSFIGLVRDWASYSHSNKENETFIGHLQQINQSLGQIIDFARSSERSTRERQNKAANDVRHNIETLRAFIESLPNHNARDEAPPESTIGLKESSETEQFTTTPSKPAFPIVKGDNIPPTDEERWKVLVRASKEITPSTPGKKEMAWARDTLEALRLNMDAKKREPDVESHVDPKVESELKKVAMDIINDMDPSEAQAVYLKAKAIEYEMAEPQGGDKLSNYSRAAQRGYRRAEYRIGKHHEDLGHTRLAVDAYTRGVRIGDSAALYRWGLIKLWGELGELQDFHLGLNMLQRAATTADQDVPDGAYIYGLLLARDSSYFPNIVHISEGTLQESPVLAKTHIERAAFLGSAPAQLRMGLAYELCQLGCELNLAYSLHYYRLAAYRGLPEAAFNISRLFVTGSGNTIMKNELLAFRYARTASRQGLPAGQFQVGYCYENGIHVSQDVVLARSWYFAAANHGSGDARERLKVLDEIAGFIAVGIDIGTTFTCVSWAHSKEPDNIHEITNWPCTDAWLKIRDQTEVPAKCDPLTGAWGFEISDSFVPKEGAKRSLISQLINDENPHAFNTIVNYLDAIWTHSRDEIQKTRSNESLSFKLAFSVPFGWPRDVYHKLQDAIVKSELPADRNSPPVCIKDSDAAILAAMAGNGIEESYSFEVGDVFVVCDCGGSALRTVSYEVVHAQPVEFERLLPYNSMSGSGLAINEQFENYMLRRSGLKFENYKSPEQVFALFANEGWEYSLKRAFTGAERPDRFALHPPPKSFPFLGRITRSQVYFLEREAVLGFFQDTVSTLRRLIDNQTQELLYKSTPKHITFVGGLAASPYLSEKLQVEYENLQLLPNPETAVSRGLVVALVRKAQVVRRFSREGFITTEYYQPQQPELIRG